jgi:hypothetical protein
MVFNGGNTLIGIPALSGRDLEGIKSTQKVVTETFRVDIANTNGTRPKILETEYSNIIVLQDTTLNFNIEESINAYSLSYLRLDSCGQWVIHLNNILGTDSKKLTNWQCNYDDQDLTWSPDGMYIGFSQDGLNDADLYVYNTANDTLLGLIVSDTMISSMNMWTPDSKLVYANRNQSDTTTSINIMNVDGSNPKRICVAPLFFYQDSYTFITVNQNNVYRTNLDCTFNEFLLDLKTIGQSYVHLSDFDPLANNLLILADPTPSITNLLVTYNINVKKIDTISVADSGWMFLLYPKYSHDFQKIAVVEINYLDTMNYTTRISLFENGSKTTLLEFSGKGEFVDSSPISFSPDDEYLAFSEDVLIPGKVAWNSYLNIINVITKQVTLIDMGKHPVWNPQKPH